MTSMQSKEGHAYSMLKSDVNDDQDFKIESLVDSTRISPPESVNSSCCTVPHLKQ
jgi:hypothetical protein